MNGKKIVIGAVLIAVVIVAAVVTVKRTTSRPQRPGAKGPDILRALPAV